MIRLTTNKLIDGILILFLVTLGSAALVNLIPGSPAALILGEGATKATIAATNREYGFNRPFWDRYGSWLDAAVHGNLGKSIQSQQPVLSLLRDRLPTTLELAILALVIALLIAIPLALVCAAREGQRLDRTVTAISSSLQSMPTFVGAVFLAELLSNKTHVFPSFGWVPLSENVGENLRHAGLPVLVLVLAITPIFLRVLRGDLSEILREDYIAAARARGLPDWYVMGWHALRPASISLFTLGGLVFGILTGGSVVVETVFSLPGVGALISTAVSGKDLPVVQGMVVILALVFLAINTIVDIGIGVIDPRIRSTTVEAR